MPAHRETRILPYTAEQVFALVADVERYPQFLPWCKATRIRSRETDTGGGEIVIADLVAGYKGLLETYTSRVVLDPGARTIEARAISGPFAHLANDWRFEPLGPACRAHFHIDFAFRSTMLQLVAMTALGKVMTRMADAFEARAGVLYGARPQDGPS